MVPTTARQDTPSVAIIVLNWNGRDDTIACMYSLQKLTYKRYQLIVVDNGSSDDSVSAIRAEFPSVHVIETGANLGFAEGNNVGIRHALDQGANYVLLLNNDTEVDEHLVDALVDAAESNADGGIFGPKIYYYAHPSMIWSAGGAWDNDKKHFDQRGDGEIDKGQYDLLVPTEFVIGCAMFIRAVVFQKIGLLEPKFFLNYEEIDFCTRSKAAGFESFYVPEAKLWHKIAASFGGEESPLKIYFTFRNRLLWAERNLPLSEIASIHWSVCMVLRARFLNPLLRFSPNGWSLKRRFWTLMSAIRSPTNQAALKGVRDYWRRRFGNCPPDVWRLQHVWKALQNKTS